MKAYVLTLKSSLSGLGVKIDKGLVSKTNIQRYLKNCFGHKNALITSLSKEYVDVFVESSRIPNFRIPLSIVSKNLQQWIIQSLLEVVIY
ncbi:hypothetical protein BpHYR1_039026 [Brachionus plicatilis]|uniref:Uncharacterized protein n=1 Tax=Brachionus plicatilis TaxID=10195 RepID=A0A3M7SBZ2_BRAPC|nr:hypothetical protein BpHYR1_039026 [Brachionus plicatilis]